MWYFKTLKTKFDSFIWKNLVFNQQKPKPKKLTWKYFTQSAKWWSGDEKKNATALKLRKYSLKNSNPENPEEAKSPMTTSNSGCIGTWSVWWETHIFKMASFFADHALVSPCWALSRSPAAATAVSAYGQISFAAAPAELFLARLISGDGLRLAAARLCEGCLGHNCRYCRSSLGNWLHLLQL